MTKSLMLIEKTSFKTKDGDNKFKYIFIDKHDDPFVGYSDHDDHEDLLSVEESFKPALAREWNVKRDVYNDKLSYRVQVDDGITA